MKNAQSDHQHSHHMKHHGGHSAFKAAAHATLHCLIGCMIGEFAGLVIGVSSGLLPLTSMFLSTALAYMSGFSITIFPLMRHTHLTFGKAFKAIWVGEAVSIGVMELIMNTIDYNMGGVRSGSVVNPMFWEALAVAVPAGYISALPVNAWLIGKQMKKCH